MCHGHLISNKNVRQIGTQIWMMLSLLWSENLLRASRNNYNFALNILPHYLVSYFTSSAHWTCTPCLKSKHHKLDWYGTVRWLHALLLSQKKLNNGSQAADRNSSDVMGLLEARGLREFYQFNPVKDSFEGCVNRKPSPTNMLSKQHVIARSM